MIPSVCAAAATFAFALIFSVRPREALLSAVTGGLAWALYLAVTACRGAEPLAYFTAALFAGLMSETLAKPLRKPATLFLVPSMIPLVPGANLYRTMTEAVFGHYHDALSEGVRALIIAGAIATGLALSASLTRIYGRVRRAG